MANITLSVDEKVLAIVRRYAAGQNSSVNALVRDYLKEIASHEDRASRARARLRRLSAQTDGRLGRKTWSRDDLHVSSARALGCHTLYSEDLNDGQSYGDVTVVNPFKGHPSR